MKKIIITFIITMMLVSFVSAQEDITLPNEKFKYFFGIKLKEWIQEKFIFNKEKLTEFHINQIEKRQLEYEKLVEKLTNANEQNKNEYKELMQKVENRRLHVQQKLEKAINNIPEDKQQEILDKLEQTQNKYKDMIENNEEIKEELEQIIENIEISEGEITTNNIVIKKIIEACEQNEGKLTAIRLKYETQNKNKYINKDFDITLPVCECLSNDDCPENSFCSNMFLGRELDKKICISEGG